MALVGLFLGLKSTGAMADLGGTVVAVVWATAIGYGFGSIFEQPRPTSRSIWYWTMTLGLVGAFFGPAVSLKSFVAQDIIAGIVGGLAGAFFGLLHFHGTRRKPRIPDSESAH
jgi:H+/Cl- antiporter ClcA